jgi:hypothetical protein
MSELERIETVLGKTARQRRWFRAWNGLFMGLFVAAFLWLLATVSFKLLPIPFGIFGGLWPIALVAVLGGFIWGGRKKDSALVTAQWVDQQLGLKEKLSAAVEFSQSSSRWGDALVRDGLKCIEQVKSEKLLRYQLPSVARWTVLLLFVSATLGFVPEYRSQSYLDQQKQEAAIKEAGQQLSSFAKRSLNHRPPKMKPTEKAMVSVDELGQRLASAKLSRTEALDTIASVTDKLKDEAKNLGENPALKRMRRESRSPSGAPSSTAKALQKQIQSLQKSMKSGANDPNALEEMKQRLDQLQKAASGMNANSDGMTPEMNQKMAESMASLSQMAKSQGMSLPDLEDAMAALENGDVDQFLKDLKSAQVDLDKMLEMAKAMEKLQMDLAQAGKDLAEQLKKGQAQAAHDRLLEMAAKMQSGDMQKEEQEQLMKELAEAIDPAGDYGEVQNLLKQALKKSQEGDSKEASKNLETAAAELKKLMDQFGDMQSLMSTLETLQQAQMCVGNCMGWGQCKSKMAGFKPGGKPGAGVGTWADENAGWFYSPPSAERWDNSEIERPDMESKGYTDRGEAAKASGMVPTKVKGKFTPGGAMPSITLRGVSIKGESRVVVEEAMTAAQSEAQSALSQQKVPRAYQQAVRNYFDDFAQ